jgi:hypothetical protein
MLIDILRTSLACSHHRNAPRSVLQDSTGVGDLHTRSVRRASGLVLAD